VIDVEQDDVIGAVDGAYGGGVRAAVRPSVSDVHSWRAGQRLQQVWGVGGFIGGALRHERATPSARATCIIHSSWTAIGGGSGGAVSDTRSVVGAAAPFQDDLGLLSLEAEGLRAARAGRAAFGHGLQRTQILFPTYNANEHSQFFRHFASVSIRCSSCSFRNSSG
jgi:hypothetical protein